MAAEWLLSGVHPVTVLVAVASAAAVRWWAPWSWAGWQVALAMAIGAVVVPGGLVLVGALPRTGTLHIAAYSVFLLGGFAVAWALLRTRRAELGWTDDQLRDALALALVSGVVGARARYVAERWDALRAQHGDQVWWVALDLDRGGAVWYGGLLLAALAVIVLRWRQRLPLLPAADVIAPAVLAGLAVGRWGCWVNGCCYGAPTTVPWAVAHPQHPDVFVHPTQLYESAATALLAAALWWWRPVQAPGRVTGAALLGYGAWRFLNEGWRGDHDVWATWPLFGRLTTSQGTSLLLLLAGVGVLAWSWWRGRRGGPAARR